MAAPYTSVLGPDSIPFYGGYGISTPYGILLPPFGKIAAYVRSTGVQDQDPFEIQNRLVTTLSAALPYVRSGKGDTIIVLPDHAENVTSATALSGLVAGTRILGIGHGSNKPTFSWTNTAGQWAVNVADVAISGLMLDLGQANGVTKAINVTGADCLMEGNRVVMGTDATHKAAIGIEVGTGANRFQFVSNKCEGVIAGAVTDGLLFAAAVVDARVTDNEFVFAAATTSMVRVGAVATLQLRILRNYFANTVASSTACVTFGAGAQTGIVAYNLFSILADGTANATGITFNAATLVRCFQNFTCDEPVKSGVLSPVVVAS